MSKNQWDADPEKYARLAEPLESPRHAEATANAFMVELSALREKHHIADLIVQYHVYCRPEAEDKEDEEHTLTLAGGGGWGDQTKQVRLAKRALDHELHSLLDMMSKFALNGMIALGQLITDPTPK